MDRITEHNVNGVVFRTADRFSAAGGVVHGFSTRYGGVSEGHLASMDLGTTRGDEPENVRENYRRFTAALGADLDHMAMTRQVHGTYIHTVEPADCKADPYAPERFDCDGLITDRPGVPLVIFSADCLPVLLYDPVKRVICAVHAGWRGTTAGIAEKAVCKMAADFGCDPSDILAAIGPGISLCHFETDGDVPAAVRAILEEETAQSCIIDHHDGKYHVDLKRVNAVLLQGAGVPEGNITIDPECTACHTEKYWSHRMVGAKRGSQAALIQLIKE